MRPELHIEAFEERKDTIFKWAVEARGIEKSQRIIGDNASKGIVELLSFYLHKNKLVEEGFQINHSWFKSDNVFLKFPGFDNKKTIISKMVELERLCEKLSYGTPKPVDLAKLAIGLFNELESLIKGML